jgi:glycosyltransferase involved in cell wall biosynthesis
MTTVSAVIPVYNGARYVAEAIASVLAQTRTPLECLVIDDGSTDSTAEVVAEFGEDVTYVRLENGGVSRARNHGIQCARGELVAFLDHDDVWLPMKLQRQVDALQAKPQASMVLCAVEMADADGKANGVKGLSHFQDLITAMLCFHAMEIPSCSSTGLMRRDWLVADGGFDPALSTCADWDLLVRSLLDTGITYVDEPLTRYRVHGSNMSRNIASIERDMVYAFAKTFADPRLPETVRARRRYAYARMYRMLAGSYRDVGDRKAMARSLAQVFRHDPIVGFALLTRLRPRGRRTTPSTYRPRES